jgi:hypothetical protein
MSAKDAFIVNGNLPMVVLKITPSVWVSLDHISAYDFTGLNPVVYLKDGRRLIVRSLTYDGTTDSETKADQFWAWISNSIEAALSELMDA